MYILIAIYNLAVKRFDTDVTGSILGLNAWQATDTVTE